MSNRVVIEFGDGGFLVCFRNGDIRWFATAAAALAAVKLVDVRTERRTGATQVTEVEWRYLTEKAKAEVEALATQEERR